MEENPYQSPLSPSGAENRGALRETIDVTPLKLIQKLGWIGLVILGAIAAAIGGFLVVSSFDGPFAILTFEFLFFLIAGSALFSLGTFLVMRASNRIDTGKGPEQQDGQEVATP